MTRLLDALPEARGRYKIWHNLSSGASGTTALLRVEIDHQRITRLGHKTTTKTDLVDLKLSNSNPGFHHYETNFNNDEEAMSMFRDRVDSWLAFEYPKIAQAEREVRASERKSIAWMVVGLLLVCLLLAQCISS
jgi:hypothetical protein